MNKKQKVAILLRGESLEELPKIYKEFDLCFLVNWKQGEFDLFGDYIIDKDIILYSNLKNKNLNPAIFEQYNITSLGYPFTSSMVTEKNGENIVVRKFKEHGVDNFYPLPEKYIDELILRPRNTGLTCILYCAGVIKFKEIWICGLDFYSGENKYASRVEKTETRPIRLNNMLYRFVRYMKEFDKINFNIISKYHDEFFFKFPNIYTFKEVLENGQCVFHTSKGQLKKIGKKKYFFFWTWKSCN